MNHEIPDWTFIKDRVREFLCVGRDTNFTVFNYEDAHFRVHGTYYGTGKVRLDIEQKQDGSTLEDK